MAAALLRVLVVVPLFSGAVACVSVSQSDARLDFAQHFSCPPDRVTVAPRPDIDPVSEASLFASTPSPDLAQDPARLAYFKQTDLALQKNILSGRKTFAATGCGVNELGFCRLWHGGGVDCVWPPQRDAIDPAAADDAARAGLAADRSALADAEAVDAQMPPGQHILGVASQRTAAGLLVVGVLSGAPADGRLKDGDIIVAADGARVVGFADVWPIEKTHLGTTITFMVKRDGALQEVVIPLGAPPSSSW